MKKKKMRKLALCSIVLIMLAALCAMPVFFGHDRNEIYKEYYGTEIEIGSSGGDNSTIYKGELIYADINSITERVEKIEEMGNSISGNYQDIIAGMNTLDTLYEKDIESIRESLSQLRESVLISDVQNAVDKSVYSSELDRLDNLISQLTDNTITIDNFNAYAQTLTGVLEQFVTHSEYEKEVTAIYERLKSMSLLIQERENEIIGMIGSNAAEIVRLKNELEISSADLKQMVEINSEVLNDDMMEKIEDCIDLINNMNISLTENQTALKELIDTTSYEIYAKIQLSSEEVLQTLRNELKNRADELENIIYESSADISGELTEKISQNLALINLLSEKHDADNSAVLERLRSETQNILEQLDSTSSELNEELSERISQNLALINSLNEKHDADNNAILERLRSETQNILERLDSTNGELNEELSERISQNLALINSLDEKHDSDNNAILEKLQSETQKLLEQLDNSNSGLDEKLSEKISQNLTMINELAVNLESSTSVFNAALESSNEEMNEKLQKSSEDLKKMLEDNSNSLSAEFTEKISSNIDLIKNLEGELEQNSNSFNAALKGSYDELTRKINDNADSFNQLLQGNYSDLSGKIKDTSDTLSQLIQNNYTELSGKISDNATSLIQLITNLDGKITQLENDLNSDVTGIDNLISDIRNQLNVINSTLSDHDGRISVNAANIKTLSESLNNLITKIGDTGDKSLSSQLSELSDRINTLNSSLNSQSSNLQGQIDALNKELEQVFTSVSNGKKLIASAITDKGILTAQDASYLTMADNISKLSKTVEISESNIGDIEGMTYIREICKNPELLAQVAKWSDVDAKRRFARAVMLDNTALGYALDSLNDTTYFSSETFTTPEANYWNAGYSLNARQNVFYVWTHCYVYDSETGDEGGQGYFQVYCDGRIPYQENDTLLEYHYNAGYENTDSWDVGSNFSSSGQMYSKFLNQGYFSDLRMQFTYIVYTAK